MASAASAELAVGDAADVVACLVLHATDPHTSRAQGRRPARGSSASDGRPATSICRRCPSATIPPRSGAAITHIAATSLDDGLVFDTRAATATAIREEDQYQAVRVSMSASLATARPSFHVDVSVGDPITPEPKSSSSPASSAGQSPYADIRSPWFHAEKIVTAIARGSASTRWRDFADMYTLTRRHPVDGTAWHIDPRGRTAPEYPARTAGRHPGWIRRDRSTAMAGMAAKAAPRRPPARPVRRGDSSRGGLRRPGNHRHVLRPVVGPGRQANGRSHGPSVCSLFARMPGTPGAVWHQAAREPEESRPVRPHPPWRTLI